MPIPSVHAGYWPFQADLAHTVVPADYLPDAPLVANATANYKLFVSRLQESKVCMFDSTIIRKSIAKFYEAFLAGCVVASDLPYEMEELFRCGLGLDCLTRLVSACECGSKAASLSLAFFLSSSCYLTQTACIQGCARLQKAAIRLLWPECCTCLLRGHRLCTSSASMVCSKGTTPLGMPPAS